MQCEIRCKSRSRSLDTVFRYTPDLLGRRSLPYLNRIGFRIVRVVYLYCKTTVTAISGSSRSPILWATAFCGFMYHSDYTSFCQPFQGEPKFSSRSFSFQVATHLPSASHLWHRQKGGPAARLCRIVTRRLWLFPRDRLYRLYHNHHCCTTAAVQAVQEWCNSGKRACLSHRGQVKDPLRRPHVAQGREGHPDYGTADEHGHAEGDQRPVGPPNVYPPPQTNAQSGTQSCP